MQQIDPSLYTKFWNYVCQKWQGRRDATENHASFILVPLRTETLPNAVKTITLGIQLPFMDCFSSHD